MRCAEAREAWFGPGSWQEPLHERVRALLGLPSDAGPHMLAELCGDEAFDVAALRRCLRRSMPAWNSQDRPEERRAHRRMAGRRSSRACRDDRRPFRRVPHEGRHVCAPPARRTKLDSGVSPIRCAARRRQHARAVVDCKVLLDLVDLLVPALTVGRRFALAWDEAKAREGLIDFDDQIRRAAALLSDKALVGLDPLQARPAVRPHPDRRGAGHQRGAVVDHRRADRRFLRRARGRPTASCGRSSSSATTSRRSSASRAPARRISRPRASATSGSWPISQRTIPPARQLQDYGLGRSFRTAQAVLDFVDTAIAAIGHERLRPRQARPSRISATSRPGLVALWQPVGSASGARTTTTATDDEAPDTWLPGPERQMADRIAATGQALADRRPASRWSRARSATPGRATSWCWCASVASWPG